MFLTKTSKSGVRGAGVWRGRANRAGLRPRGMAKDQLIGLDTGLGRGVGVKSRKLCTGT